MKNIFRSTRVFIPAVALVAYTVAFTSMAETQTDKRGMKVQQTVVGSWPSASKRFAVTIGVDEYDDPQVGRLDGASNDARALADALVRYAGFPQDQVIVLASDQPKERWPTRGNILRRLSNLRAAVPSDGLLLVAFAGHGIESDGQAFLLPTDAQVNGDMSLLEDTAINVETVRKRIRDTGVRQVVILLDACRSDNAGRGSSDRKMTEAYVRGFNFDVRNGEITAFATLYATEIGNRAYESKEKRHGYFTWSLVEGLQGAAGNDKGEVTLSGLVKYLETSVPRQVLLDLGKEIKQKPFAIIEGYKADELVIAVSPSFQSGPDLAELGISRVDASQPGARPDPPAGSPSATSGIRSKMTPVEKGGVASAVKDEKSLATQKGPRPPLPGNKPLPHPPAGPKR